MASRDFSFTWDTVSQSNTLTGVSPPSMGPSTPPMYKLHMDTYTVWKMMSRVNIELDVEKVGSIWSEG